MALRALLAHIIDYAGLYPPAALPLPEVVQRYDCYRELPESWMLGRLVLPRRLLDQARPKPGWRVTLLVDDDPGPLPEFVETIETKRPAPFVLPTYCEAPLEEIHGAYAKIRTGGDTVPSAETVADFLHRAAQLRMPFKATAGLHHPLPTAGMHGFLNVFIAAAFAWHGAERSLLLEILHATDPPQFTDDGLRCCGHTLTTAQIESARRDFAHSFGSCSFEEPIADLRALGLLP